MWPLKAIPASLMLDFCTGAVTIAAYSPERQPDTAASSVESTGFALAGSGSPGFATTASGQQGELFDRDGVGRVLARSQKVASQLSDALTLRYFSHVYDVALPTV